MPARAFIAVATVSLAYEYVIRPEQARFLGNDRQP
jgi:hypothetical protein